MRTTGKFEPIRCANCGLSRDIVHAVRTTGVELTALQLFVCNPDAVCCQTFYRRVPDVIAHQSTAARFCQASAAVIRRVMRLRPNARSWD